MQDDDWLTARFEESRPRLHALAYRMLGSHAEADDAVQETWLRLRRNDPDQIENVGGLLTTVVGRVCLDRLRARRARPEDPVDDLAVDAAVRTPTPPATRSTRRYSPSRWAPRSWSCSIASDRRSEWRSCSTTCSACRSTTSPRSSAAVPTRLASSRAGLAVDCRAARRMDASTSYVNATWSTRSCAPRAAATSTRSCSCSIPTWCSSPTPPRSRWDRCARRAAPKRSPQSCRGRCGRGARTGRRRAAWFVWAPGGQIRGVVQFTVHDDRIVADRRHRRRRAHRRRSRSSRSIDVCHISLLRVRHGGAHTLRRNTMEQFVI